MVAGHGILFLTATATVDVIYHSNLRDSAGIALLKCPL